MRAIQITQPGGPEVLTISEIERPSAGPDQAVVEISLAGVNFIDVYHRIGRYPKPLPFVPGAEGVGVISELCPDAPSDLRIGDRVGWVMSTGGYGEAVALTANTLIPLPDDISDEDALALLLQGMTTHYLAHDSYTITPGDIAVVHSAAGGVGLLLTRYVKSLGGVVVATASTPEKRALALAAGADIAVPYEGFRDHVMEVSQGAGAHVVYDGVGKDTFDESIASLRRRGTMVLYGAASGPVPAFEPTKLAVGSIFFTRPSLGDFVANRLELIWRANEVFAAFRRGAMQVAIGGRYPLASASQAHIDLEGRKTTGKLVIQVR